ncbi:MAG: hypothetical protein Q8K59_12840, partial [Nitrosomonas sp.]|nr:hypothetical protein [Nitrosomonas sp.]
MKQKLSVLFSLMVLVSLVLAACGGGAPAATEEAAPEAPAATEAPTEPMADFEGKSLTSECVAPQIIQSVVATGQYEVTFSLCQPDPAFTSKIAF